MLKNTAFPSQSRGAFSAPPQSRGAFRAPHSVQGCVQGTSVSPGVCSGHPTQSRGTFRTPLSPRVHSGHSLSPGVCPRHHQATPDGSVCPTHRNCLWCRGQDLSPHLVLFNFQRLYIVPQPILLLSHLAPPTAVHLSPGCVVGYPGVMAPSVSCQSPHSISEALKLSCFVYTILSPQAPVPPSCRHALCLLPS